MGTQNHRQSVAQWASLGANRGYGHQVEAIEAAGELSGNAESSSSLTLYRLPA